jgi:hypothetical protein
MQFNTLIMLMHLTGIISNVKITVRMIWIDGKRFSHDYKDNGWVIGVGRKRGYNPHYMSLVT